MLSGNYDESPLAFVSRTSPPAPVCPQLGIRCLNEVRTASAHSGLQPDRAKPSAIGCSGDELYREVNLLDRTGGEPNQGTAGSKKGQCVSKHTIETHSFQGCQRFTYYQWAMTHLSQAGLILRRLGSRQSGLREIATQIRRTVRTLDDLSKKTGHGHQ